MRKLLFVAGDPIKDTYLTVDENNKFLEKETLPGGALNTYSNAVAINSENNVEVLWLTPELNHFYEIFRINEKIVHPHSNVVKKNFYFRKNLRESLLSNIDAVSFTNVKASALLLSDYNKGFLNSVNRFIVKSKFDYLILDSKYRSINLNFLQYGKIKIWRCTGSEYDDSFAKNFDIVVWTDGPNPIKIFKNHTLAFTAVVPRSEVIDTCGAGDTFTAALISALLEDYSLEDAILFSIKASANVIQRLRTQTTNIKL
tara:strand:+ start:1360 stop:2130 length:771 start_codon:yes stop_codon:yes gene_type:complete